MACRAMYRWSLIGLVGAFLDLAIAYFLLCASAVAFMASKFLGFFGLCLPCPCNGVFGADPNPNLCVQKLLLEYPTEKVSRVQLSVMSKFPFNGSVWGKNQNCNLNVRLIGDRGADVIELEGEASCSSASDARKSNNILRIKGELNSRNEIGAANVIGVRDGRFDLKGKGIMHLRPRSGMRRRRKGGFHYGKYSSVSLYDPPFGEAQDDPPHSPPSFNKGGNELVEDNIVLQDYRNNRQQFNYTEEVPTTMRLQNRSSNILDLNEFADECKHVIGLKGNVGSGLDVRGEDKNTIRLLEQALEEELASRAALYLELEKERSAAASAADEAMAMIQRLQEEKASIEMEARQYQRMIEEKSAYDAEEMNILKEIIVWREMEKHFVEKEVEAYRQISYLGNEQSSTDGADFLDSQQKRFDSSSDPNEDPLLMLPQLSASIDKKVMIENKKTDESPDKGIGVLAPQDQRLDDNSSFQPQGDPTGNLSQFLVCNNNDTRDLQDKMISIDHILFSPTRDLQQLESFSESFKPGSSQDKLLDKTATQIEKGSEYYDNMNIPAEMENKSVGTLPVPCSNGSLKQHENDLDQETQSSCNLFEKELYVHDVHVIVGQSNSFNQVYGSKLETSVNSTSEIPRKNFDPSEASAFRRVNATIDCQSTSSLDAEVDIRRCNSDITSRLPPICPKGKTLLTDLQRNSSSMVDNERLKIDYEVGWLQERLRVVQQGREKLNLSVEHQEREKMQLKLLENIAHQLQEIRQLTEPGKAIRQASLPPPSSKAIWGKPEMLIEERSRGKVRVVRMGKATMRWVIRVLREMLSEDFAKTLANRNFIAQVRRNGHGEYMEVVEFGNGGFRGMVVVPRGRGSRGWLLFAAKMGEILKEDDKPPAMSTVASRRENKYISYATAVKKGSLEAEEDRGKGKEKDWIFPRMDKNSNSIPSTLSQWTEMADLVQKMQRMKKELDFCILKINSWLPPGLTVGQTCEKPHCHTLPRPQAIYNQHNTAQVSNQAHLFKGHQFPPIYKTTQTQTNHIATQLSPQPTFQPNHDTQQHKFLQETQTQFVNHVAHSTQSPNKTHLAPKQKTQTKSPNPPAIPETKQNKKTQIQFPILLASSNTIPKHGLNQKIPNQTSIQVPSSSRTCEEVDDGEKMYQGGGKEIMGNVGEKEENNKRVGYGVGKNKKGRYEEIVNFFSVFRKLEGDITEQAVGLPKRGVIIDAQEESIVLRGDEMVEWRDKGEKILKMMRMEEDFGDLWSTQKDNKVNNVGKMAVVVEGSAT